MLQIIIFAIFFIITMIVYGYYLSKSYYKKGYEQGWQDKDSVRLFNNEFMP
jgi:hypothetical protein